MTTIWGPWLRLRKLMAWRARHSPKRRQGVHLNLEHLEDRSLPSNVFPYVQSITRTIPPGPTTTASSVSYNVTFNEAVTGVSASSFSLALTGTLTAALVQVVPVSTSVYTVTVSGI